VSDTDEQDYSDEQRLHLLHDSRDLRSTLRVLAEKKRSGQLQFERVVIETTVWPTRSGSADVFSRCDIAERYLLDSILTFGRCEACCSVAE